MAILEQCAVDAAGEDNPPEMRSAVTEPRCASGTRHSSDGDDRGHISILTRSDLHRVRERRRWWWAVGADSR